VKGNYPAGSFLLSGAVDDSSVSYLTYGEDNSFRHSERAMILREISFILGAVDDVGKRN